MWQKGIWHVYWHSMTKFLKSKINKMQATHAKYNFFYIIRFLGQKRVHKKWVIFYNTIFATRQYKLLSTIPLSPNHYIIVKIDYYLNINILNITYPAFPITFTQKYGPQIEFTTKQCMFSLKVYLSHENFTLPLVKMVVPFCISDSGYHFIRLQASILSNQLIWTFKKSFLKPKYNFFINQPNL